MTRIALADKNEIFMKTSFWYGVLRTGKTFLSGTFPRVAWFGSEREGGFRTLQNMDKSDFYEPEYPPELFGIKNPAEFMTHLNRDVMPLIAKGRIKTIVIEASIYSDEVIRQRADDVGWAKYADLEKHFTHVDELLKNTPARICYNALATSEEDSKKPAGPLMAGRAVPRKLPSLIDVVGYMRSETVNDKRDFLAHFAPYANYPAGHRYKNKFPLLVRNPTFRLLEALYYGRATVDGQGNITEVPGAALQGLPPLGK